jgi:hypothetical protein
MNTMIMCRDERTIRIVCICAIRLELEGHFNCRSNIYQQLECGIKNAEEILVYDQDIWICFVL